MTARRDVRHDRPIFLRDFDVGAASKKFFSQEEKKA
jgi:hypothetical protein